MQKVRILTDDATSTPKELIERYNIINLPVLVYINDECYEGENEISLKEVYERMEAGEVIKTAAPTVGHFISAFQSLKGECESVICIHITENLAVNSNTARLAAEQCPDMDITVFPSDNVGMGTGMLIWAAAEAAQQGKSKEEILVLLEKARKNSKIYAALPTVKYAARSGRIKVISALFASMLSIKPILTGTKEGIEVCEKVRTFPAAVNKVIELAAENCKGKPDYIAICHTNALDQAKAFLPLVKEKIEFDESKMVYSELKQGMAVHGGLGIFGIATLNLD